MLDELYFNLSVSVSEPSYNGLLRYVDSPVMYVRKVDSLHYVKAILLRKIARFIIAQFRCSDHSKLLSYSYLIHENGTVKILSTDSSDNCILLYSFSLHFASLHRAGKQPLSKTAVMISRTFNEGVRIQSVVKV